MQQYLSLSCRAVDAGANRHGQMRDAATLRKRDLVMKDFAFALPNHATTQPSQPTSLSISMRAGISFNLSTNTTTFLFCQYRYPMREAQASFLHTRTRTHTTFYLSSITRPLLFAATRATVSADQRTKLSISSKYPDTFLCL